jgi:hypothetical protein
VKPPVRTRRRTHKAACSRGGGNEEIKVEVRPDFLERQAKAQPIQALAELIWNGLDADATAIHVEIENDALGGMSKIVVTDNGHGMPRADAPQLSQNLGGSWKRHRLGTRGLNRMLHGQEGRSPIARARLFRAHGIPVFRWRNMPRGIAISMLIRTTFSYHRA